MTRTTALTYGVPGILLTLVLLSGCATWIESESLDPGRNEGPAQPVIIDVRTKGEFEKGHIPGAVNISVLSLPFNLGRIPVSSRDRRVVVYCAHGPRAGLAGFFLRAAGFSDVKHLRGDFGGWKKSGRPIDVGVGG